jgi:hypothetical protein
VFKTREVYKLELNSSLYLGEFFESRFVFLKKKLTSFLIPDFVKNGLDKKLISLEKDVTEILVAFFF